MNTCPYWWCETCKKYVEPNHVTFDEYHDPRYGGCGETVTQRKPLSDDLDRKKLAAGFVQSAMMRYKRGDESIEDMVTMGLEWFREFERQWEGRK